MDVIDVTKKALEGELCTWMRIALTNGRFRVTEENVDDKGNRWYVEVRGYHDDIVQEWMSISYCPHCGSNLFVSKNQTGQCKALAISNDILKEEEERRYLDSRDPGYDRSD